VISVRLAFNRILFNLLLPTRMLQSTLPHPSRNALYSLYLINYLFAVFKDTVTNSDYTNKQTPWFQSAKRTIPTERPPALTTQHKMILLE
jgi:phytoene/squalene synthetase